MTWAPAQTQIAVYTVLKNDSALAALLGTTVGGAQKIFDNVPDKTPWPFITIHCKPWSDRGSYTYEGLEGQLSVDVWYQPGGSTSVQGRGDKQVQAIQARVDALLHKQYLTISGWNTLQLRRAVIDILTDPDNVTKHGVQQFKILLGGQ